MCLLAKPKDKLPYEMKPLRNFPLLSLSLSFVVPLSLCFALQADRFVRLKGSAQSALVVSANNGKDVMAFRDKQRYLAEDVSLTCACISRRVHTHTHAFMSFMLLVLSTVRAFNVM